MTSQVIINDYLPKTQSTASSGQTVFSTNWTANVESDIDVYQRASGVAANDATQKLLISQYNVAFVGSEQDVEVTLLTPATLGDIITIIRNTPAQRLNLYTNTNFTPSMLNEDVGILTLVDQQAQLSNDLITPHFNLSCTLTDVDLPQIDLILPVLGANQLWIKNSNNTGMTTLTLTGEPAPDDAFYWVSEGDTGLTNEVNVGANTTGLLKITVTSGNASPSTAVLGTDYYGPSQPSPIPIDAGGTEATSFTSYGVVCGGTTSGGPLQSIAVGTANQVLTSNGAGALPSFQTPSSASIPIGSIIDFGGTVTPSGYLICDGSAVSRTTYSSLFAAISTTWGIGDGTTTFNLPDMQRRVTMGSGGSGTAIIGNGVGNTGGEEAHTMTTAELVPHPHNYTQPVNYVAQYAGGGQTASSSSTTSSTDNGPGSATPFNVIQPAAIVLKCIRYQ